MNITRSFGIAPVLMNEAGDGGAGGGDTALALTTGTDLTTSADGTGDSTALDTTTGTAIDATEGHNEPIFDGKGGVTQSTSKAFKELETANPKLRPVLARAQRALATFARLTHMLGPKPFDEIARLTKFEKEVGGTKGIAALRASVEDMEKSDSLYARADPALITMMTETRNDDGSINEINTKIQQQAFTKLFPHVVNRVQEIAPQTYTRWIGRQMLHVIEKHEISLKDQTGKLIFQGPIDMPFRLRRIFDQLPALDGEGRFAGGTLTPIQQQALYTDLAAVFNWVETIRAWSNATPEDLTPPKEDASEARVKEAKDAADAALQETWKVKRDTACDALIHEEIRKQTKGMDLASTITADIAARARKAINEIRKAQPDNNAKVGRFFESKNLNGYLAYNKGIVEDNVQAQVEKAVALYSRKANRRTAQTDTTATTTASTTATTSQTTATTQTGKVTRLSTADAEKIGGITGATRWMKQSIGGQPGTTPQMLRSRQYMLRKGNPLGLPDGTIVQFP